PDVACILPEHDGNSPGGRRPTVLLIERVAVKMRCCEGVTPRPMGNLVDSLAPQASMSVSPGGKIERPAVRRPVGPVLNPGIRDGDPGAFGNRSRPIQGRDGEARAIGRNPNRKTDPASVG